MADLRIGKVMVLLQATRLADWSPTDVTMADGATVKFRQAYEEITRELPQVLAIRKRYPRYLVPAYAELPMAILDSWTRTIHAEGPNWRSAAMLSNTQDIPLATIPGALPVEDARRIQDQLVRDNDRGLNALMALGSNAGLLMWAPTEHEQVLRLLAVYEVAAVQLADPIKNRGSNLQTPSKTAVRTGRRTTRTAGSANWRTELAQEISCEFTHEIS